MNNIFAIGDIHGQISMLEKLLKSWKCDNEQLVFLGDYIDRGENSYGVIHRVRHLVENYGAVAIGGNHELVLLDWLNNPEDYWFEKWREDESILNDEEEAGNSHSIYYYSLGGDKTINSFYEASKAYKEKPSVHASYIRSFFKDELEFIDSLPDYFETEAFLFVHAGFDLGLENWRDTPKLEMRWTRKEFHEGINETGKTIVFGHHPTRYLNADKSNDIWISSCNTKVGIDGGAVHGGLLHGFVIDENGNKVYSVNKGLETKTEMNLKLKQRVFVNNILQ